MNTLDWKNATPEQLNFWRIAKGKLAYATITPMFYCGVIAASEFLTYDATKLYIALELEFCGFISNASQSQVQLYDESNAQNFMLCNDFTYAVNIFMANNLQVKNHYFGRFSVININYMKFNGYKLHT
jgi:hypothetical protein